MRKSGPEPEGQPGPFPPGVEQLLLRGTKPGHFSPASASRAGAGRCE